MVRVAEPVEAPNNAADERRGANGLAQLKYADGKCSWVVGWPFAVTRVQTACTDVWLTSGPSVLARIGDIVVAIAAVLLAGGSLLLVGRRCWTDKCMIGSVRRGL
jgi:hypothetical protein